MSKDKLQWLKAAVLIETSWNVKDYESRCESVKEYSINRNIVECKGESS